MAGMTRERKPGRRRRARRPTQVNILCSNYEVRRLMLTTQEEHDSPPILNWSFSVPSARVKASGGYCQVGESPNIVPLEDAANHILGSNRP